mmetsp:Transcript_22861/g.58259  ORF Transcript_22861/g.58259 Transcript_22861/m.58259 type:complete len:550 (-) Transcript_22861:416-2065(-)|eukprot:CAMPEP_0202858360 /NCGR_PEP_ID=MMETSP1391-20130828/928_1 /ASSEMBLY_ACC=CAM_ASM_000867 /TAXON_ID=1034604 /ORGANISM="Chlamydomonas leiostraca, Strain SAG 11-49" /LENGTH=549 /DNA_ID=CAMNT_0049537275 /DNA_START=39 /DNA_END=1688 /DNA_ORIENTATION=-
MTLGLEIALPPGAAIHRCPSGEEYNELPEQEPEQETQPTSPSSSENQPLVCTVQNASSKDVEVPEVHHTFSWFQFARFIGSGLLASVAYLDPGNLEADIQLGVESGMTLLWWTGICCLIFGFTFQCISGRLGLCTGQDLAQHLGARYPKPARILLWILIEIAIIGADIQETIGSAIALLILTNGKLPLAAGCVVVSFTAFGLLLLDRVGFRSIEAVFAVFIAIEAVCMGLNFVEADIPSVDVAKGIFIPKLTSQTLPVAVAALGALVMPYNIYFSSAIVNARPRGADSSQAKRTLLKYLRLENFLVLVMAFVINMFVICVFADAFYGTGEQVGLETAGEHLGTRYGAMFETVWAVGLLASGQVATIGLTHAGQLVMMGLLNMKVHAGPRMMVTRLVALVPTVTLAVVFEASHTFDKVAQLLNIVQALMLPFALIPVLHVAADPKIMGVEFASPKWLTVFAGSIAAAVSAINGYLMVDLLRTSMPHAGPGVLVAFSLGFILYYCVVAYYAVGPEHWGPVVGGRLQQWWAKSRAWLRENSRKADFQSLMEA